MGGLKEDVRCFIQQNNGMNIERNKGRRPKKGGWVRIRLIWGLLVCV